MEVELLQQSIAPSVVNHDGHPGFSQVNPEVIEQVMDSISAEIRYRLVRNISAYCDCE